MCRVSLGEGVMQAKSHVQHMIPHLGFYPCKYKMRMQGKL